MSHELNALIATAELLNVVAAEVPVAQVARLEQGLALIPMTARLYSVLDQPAGASPLGFELFPGGFALRLEAWSKAGPIAYVQISDVQIADVQVAHAQVAHVQAEHAGGPGSQRAAVWEDGALVLGPLHSASDAPAHPDGSPVSQALRLLGVRRGESYDEFEAVGLGGYQPLAG